MEEAVRWNIKVSKETDLTLRTFLGSQGMKRATSRNSSKRPFAGACFIAPFRTSRRATPIPIPDELQALIDDAVREVRDDRRAKGKADKA